MLMSFTATRWAWEQKLRPAEKLVLLSLADRVRDPDHVCWPSITRLQHDTGLHRETIFKAVRKLENRQFMSVERVQGKGHRYHLHVADQSEEIDQSEIADQSQKAEGTGRKTRTPPSRKIPTLNLLQEPTNTHIALLKKTSMPEGFAVSERVRTWGERQGYFNLDAHFEHFVTACSAHGYRYVDWDAAFMAAVTNDWAKLGKGWPAGKRLVV